MYLPFTYSENDKPNFEEKIMLFTTIILQNNTGNINMFNKVSLFLGI